jgi:UDP:flavonoid glycosyltransferase YjiC (YdhE family)
MAKDLIINFFGKKMNVNKIIPSSLMRKFFLFQRKTLQKIFNQTLKVYGLPPIKNGIGYLEGDLTLLIDIEELTPITNLPSNYLFFQPQSLPFGSKYPWFKEIKEAKAQGKKIIFLSMGSSAKNIYPQVLRQLCEHVKVNENLVLITNHCGLIKEDVALFRNKNIYIEDFIAIQDLLEHIDLAITHGGKNSINEFILAGLPIIGIPQQNEQLINLNYVEERGLGLYLNIQDIQKNSQYLINAINKILQNDSYLDAAQSMKYLTNEVKIRNNNIIAAIHNLLK